MMSPERRRFLKLLAAGALPQPVVAADAPPSRAKVRIALIADVHQDVVHDGMDRLNAFLTQAREWRADAVMELGDFCTPKPRNRAFADAFEAYPGKRFHVIGNHDTDGGFKSDQVVAFHRMPGRYYSADLNGIHLVVLDANDVPPGHRGGYPSFIAKDQIAWLTGDLAAAAAPVVVFSHQSLERPNCIASQAEVRKVLEGAKRADGSNKVVACFNGHWHIDHARRINGIPYIHLNSASYYWMNKPHPHIRYSKETDAACSCMRNLAPYRKPLFTVLEIDPVNGRFTLSSSDSEWVGPSPHELGSDFGGLEPSWIVPRCSARSDVGTD